MKVITDERCTEYSSRGHPEHPARVAKTVERLKAQTELTIDWEKPAPVTDEILLRAHTQEHLTRLLIPHDFDGDTAYHKDIGDHARRSVGGAMAALEFARTGKLAFSLLRPPGHHATRNQAMGFCYLNSAAIAALHAQAIGTKRIAVFDFDVHHGNGTEAIFVDRPGLAFYSIHQFPCYPGTGSKNVGNNCFNYTVAPHSPREHYQNTLKQALKDLKKFSPDLIVVSAGFDAYARDPLAQGSLEVEDYHWLGKELREFGVPMFSLLEGGYSSDLPELIFAYLKGIDGK